MVSLGQSVRYLSTPHLQPYRFLIPISRVRFPGHDVGNSKIPSVMYYDKTGKVMAAGAEAEMALSQAEDEEWIKTELYVFNLNPEEYELKSVLLDSS